MFTGEIEDRSLRFEFGRVGLQHLLAISGFHFAILSAFAAFFARMAFPPCLRNWALLGLLASYFLFVGDSPPVQRSFLAASLALIGQMSGRRSSGLNILGACLLIELIFDPLAMRNLGFQLSFLSCFGILLFYTPIRKTLEPYFPKRPFEATAALPLSAQLAYLASGFFFRAFCLTLAVNAALAPLLLIHFHRFPWLSLVYNLIVPELAALCLFLLLGALALYAYQPLFGIPILKSARAGSHPKSSSLSPIRRRARIYTFFLNCPVGRSPCGSPPSSASSFAQKQNNNRFKIN